MARVVKQKNVTISKVEELATLSEEIKRLSARAESLKKELKPTITSGVYGNCEVNIVEKSLHKLRDDALDFVSSDRRFKNVKDALITKVTVIDESKLEQLIESGHISVDSAKRLYTITKQTALSVKFKKKSNE